MLSGRVTTRALIGSLTLSAFVLVVGVESAAIASPPGGGGGFGRPSTGDWINFGIGAAQAINNSRQQGSGRGRQSGGRQQPQQNYHPQPQQNYYPPVQQQQIAPPKAPPAAPIQVNAIPEQKVEPEKNAVPLTDMIVPMRKREAKCYMHSLSENIGAAGESADTAWQQHKKAIGQQLLSSLAKLVTDPAVLEGISALLTSGDFTQARAQIDALNLTQEQKDALAKNLDAGQDIDRQMSELLARLKEEAAWTEVQKSLDDLANAITQLSQGAAANPQAPPQMGGVVNGIGELANLLMIRDILALAIEANGPTRFTPIAVDQIPTGIIRVIYDPDLPVGTGLWVNETCIIAGSGGRGELQTGIASAAEALGLPVVPGDPVADLGQDETPPKGGVLIGNPAENSGSIKYVLASVHPYALEPGFLQHLPGSQSWLIEFDRGGQYGSARYTLAEGIYDFKVGEKGWDIVSRPLKAVIDNRDGVDDFYYIQDNKKQTVKAGEMRTIENKSPVVISFDRGEDVPSRKLLNKSGTYKVAVNIDNNRYDLFAPVEPEKSEGVDVFAGSGE